jgi:hypothetical protein
MDYWHDNDDWRERTCAEEAVCGTTHCLAGWAVHLAGKEGYAIEKAFGWRAAGAAIYRASVGEVPHFFASNARAIEGLRRRAKQAAECTSASFRS